VKTDRQGLQPWIIRTYAGFGEAAETNRRFHENLRAGQTGLSVAFDLPTQNGYDPDASIARGEIGRTGVSIAHIGDLRELFRGIDPARVNTSMTINATAPFLFALYLVNAEEQGVSWTALRGTVQNDLLKEFVARGTYIFDPDTSLRLSTDLITFAANEAPGWNPINICGYHYMESGAGPGEETGFAFANALLLLDTVRPLLSPSRFETVVRKISFFINSGIELVPEICKMRAYAQLWAELCRKEYGIEGVPFRSGCQVRSISLTAEQPENNIVRIALQALPAIVSESARVNALQLPGFREALKLPDRMEQVLSIRTQQILMHETKLTDYGDIFEGSRVIEDITRRTKEEATELADRLRKMGYRDAICAIGKHLTRAITKRQEDIRSGTQVIVGVNAFQEPVGLSEQLSSEESAAFNDAFEENRRTALQRWKAGRDDGRLARSSEDLRESLRSDGNIMPATVEFARAGGTLGEWTSLIESAGEGRYLAPMFLTEQNGSVSATASTRRAKPFRVVLGKCGLDGHTNGLKVLATSLKDAGLEVIFAGTKQSPESLFRTAIEEDADAIAVSTLSGAHMAIASGLLSERRKRQSSPIRLILGGIIPPADAERLRASGVDLVIGNEGAGIDRIVTQVCSLLSA